MSEPNDPVERRATFLPMLMAVIAAGFFCVVMIFVTGGFFFYVVGIGLLFVLLGLFHYLLWGRAMDQEATAERQRLEALEKAQENLKRGTNWTYRR
jgi:high-affinity Fe2+/Pb2+ permease